MSCFMVVMGAGSSCRVHRVLGVEWVEKTPVSLCWFRVVTTVKLPLVFRWTVSASVSRGCSQPPTMAGGALGKESSVSGVGEVLGF